MLAFTSYNYDVGFNQEIAKEKQVAHLFLHVTILV